MSADDSDHEFLEIERLRELAEAEQLSLDKGENIEDE